VLNCRQETCTKRMCNWYCVVRLATENLSSIICEDERATGLPRVVHGWLLNGCFLFMCVTGPRSLKLPCICRHETVFVNLKNKPVWLFERNPVGAVPILEYKGHVIYESAVCNDFLEEAFPGSVTGTHPLLPSCPYERAAVRLLMLRFDKVCMSLTFVILYCI